MAFENLEKCWSDVVVDPVISELLLLVKINYEEIDFIASSYEIRRYLEKNENVDFSKVKYKLRNCFDLLASIITGNIIPVCSPIFQWLFINRCRLKCLITISIVLIGKSIKSDDEFYSELSMWDLIENDELTEKFEIFSQEHQERCKKHSRMLCYLIKDKRY